MAFRWIDLANDDSIYPPCDCGAEDSIIVVESCANPNCEKCDLTGQLAGYRFQCPTCYVRDHLPQLTELPSGIIFEYGEFVRVPEPGAEEVR